MRSQRVGVTFDVGRKATGWALWEEREPVRVGVIHLPEGFLGQQVSLFRRKLLRMLPTKLDWIAYEDARAVSKQHGMILFALTGMLHEVAWNRGVAIPGFAQSTIKKQLAGHGRASKDDMIQAAQERYPHLDVQDDNIADALGVGVAFWATQSEEAAD